MHMLNTTAQLYILSPGQVAVLFEGRVFIKHAKEIQLEIKVYRFCD